MQEPDADAIVDAALGAGITFVDTAPHYGLGVAERRLGCRLAQVPRDRFAASTVGRLVRPPRRARWLARRGFVATPAAKRVWDFSRDGVRRSLEESLERLGLDRVDVALVHDPDNHEREAAEQAFPAPDELRDQGVVRHRGRHGPGRDAHRFVGELDLDLRHGRPLQPPRSEGTGRAAAGLRRARGGGGDRRRLQQRAAGRPRPGATFDYAPRPRRSWSSEPAVSRRSAPGTGCRCGRPPWPSCSATRAVASVLVGARTAAEVQDVVAMVGRPVPAELWAELVAEGPLPGQVPVPTS